MHYQRMSDTPAISERGDEQCDYHYYFCGDAPYPAFMCGLPKDHEGEHKEISKIYLEKTRERIKAIRHD